MIIPRDGKGNLCTPNFGRIYKAAMDKAMQDAGWFSGPQWDALVKRVRPEKPRRTKR